MITGPAIIKLAAKNAVVHCITRDYGPLKENGMGGVHVDHYATKGQADREMSGAFSDVVKPVYSTRPAADFVEQARADFFFVLF